MTKMGISRSPGSSGKQNLFGGSNLSQTIEFILKTTTNLVQRMVKEARVKAKIVDRENQEVIWVNVETENDPQFLIGQRGTNLAALQHLVRLMVRRKVKELVNFVLDVNSYKEKRIDYLHKLARISAARVAKTKKPLILEVMPPFERRIVHLTLAQNEEVTTESTGEEGERRVIIKPRER